jgi:hypothetical protein
MVSLGRLDEAALQALRTDGTCSAALPESLFDRDHPGHFMRRLASVALSIPAVQGPYAGVPCTLTLLRSTVRVSATAEPYARQGDEDPRFADSNRTVRATVRSLAPEGNSLLEVSNQEERYRPFERAGAISSWKIELPPASRRFDHTTISDVVLQVRYTARDGGPTLRRAAAARLARGDR